MKNAVPYGSSSASTSAVVSFSGAPQLVEHFAVEGHDAPHAFAAAGWRAITGWSSGCGCALSRDHSRVTLSRRLRVPCRTGR